MNRYLRLLLLTPVFAVLPSFAADGPVDYVNTLIGTDSKFELSTGNTYPATALPPG